MSANDRLLRDHVTKALMKSFKSQFDGHRIPGDAAPDSWTATGDMHSLDMELMADAAIEAVTRIRIQMMNKAALDAAFWTYCKATGLNPESHPAVEEAVRQAIDAYLEHANKHPEHDRNILTQENLDKALEEIGKHITPRDNLLIRHSTQNSSNPTFDKPDNIK